MSYKIVLCSSGMEVDSWKVCNWLENYNRYLYDFPVVLLYDVIPLETQQLWKKPLLEVKELFQINNMMSQDNPVVFNHIRTIMLKMLAYRYCGNCIVCDLNYLPFMRITENMIPDCKWAALHQDQIIPEYNQTWHNIVYQKFSEYSYVEQIFESPQIITFDTFKLYYELFMKYKSQFFDIYYYPRLQTAIMSLAHKIAGGTYLNSNWCSLYDEKRSTYFKFFYNEKSFINLLKKDMTVPAVQIK